MTRTNTSTILDVIDLLAGIEPGDAADALRTRRPQTRLHAQQSYLALFEPASSPAGDEPTFTTTDRFAVATFVAVLHQQDDVAAFYADHLAAHVASSSLKQAVIAEAVEGLATGPWGYYPSGPLSREDLPGRVFVVSKAGRSVLGARLSAALAHSHLLVLHPRDAEAAALQSLLEAGWSTPDIVTLSQLVAFLSFQIRVIVGLRALAATPSAVAVLSESVAS